MFENIRNDIDRHYKISRGKTSIIKLFIFNYGFQATMVYRFGKWAECQGTFYRYLLLPLYYLLEFCIGNLYGIHIERKASIGKGLYIGHCGGIYVGRCTIGAFCSIHQHVKIKPDSSGCPKVGNQVWIGAHTQITGRLTVGQNTALGAGAVVNADIGERCLALGNPARVIKKDFDNRRILFGQKWKEQDKSNISAGKNHITVYSQKSAHA